MVGKRGFSKLGFLIEDAAWTHETVPFLKKQFPQIGLSIEGIQWYPVKETNYQPYYSKIADLDIDAIFGLSANSGVGPLQGYFKANTNVPLIGDLVPVQSPSFIRDMGGKGNGIVARTHATWSEQMSDTGKQFVDDWENAYSSRPAKPEWAGLGTYAHLQQYAEAVDKAGSTNADDVVPALEEAEFKLGENYAFFGKGEKDPITGKEFTHDLKVGPDFFQSVWSQWQDGTQVTIWPDSLADGSYNPV